MSANSKSSKLLAILSRRRYWWPRWSCSWLSGRLRLLRPPPFWRLASQFDDLTYRQPSRLYARSAVLQAGRAYPPELLIQSLRDEGYREASGGGSLPAGRYRKTGRIGKGKIEGKTAEKGDKKKTDAAEKTGQHRHDRGPSAQLPAARWPAWRPGGGLLQRPAHHRPAPRRRGRQGGPLQPALIGTYFGSDLQERRPVKVDNVFRGSRGGGNRGRGRQLLRALGRLRQRHHPRSLVDLRGGEIRQGGSTLTQQLVKNIYLSHQRHAQPQGAGADPRADARVAVQQAPDPGGVFSTRSISAAAAASP